MTTNCAEPLGEEIIDWREFLYELPSLEGNVSVVEASEFFKGSEARFVAVEQGGQVLGICSRSRIGGLLGSQFGYALYQRARVVDYLEEKSLVVSSSESVVSVLGKAFSRDESCYLQDVVVIDASGGYLGLLKANVLAKLQNEMLSEKIEHLELRTQELEATSETLRLTNHQLEIARDEGLQAARAKSEFLAVMSHEIRTPLNGVIGMMTLLADSNLQRDQRELLTAANESAEALLLILNDILDFSRLESGKVDLDMRRFDVRELAESVLTLMVELAQESGLEVLCDIDTEVPRSIVSDSGRIRQILANLLGNAVKFTERGRIRLGVTNERRGDGARVLRFEVEDTGIGISAEAQDRLFQPFAQADSSTTRRFGGTGLGLAICSQLVKAMGGVMGLDSEEGRGSRFWFTVVCGAKPGEEDPYEPARSESEKVALVFLGSRESMGQVERELACRNILSLTVDSAELFREALRNCRDRLDLLVCDAGLLDEKSAALCGDLPMVSAYSSHGCEMGGGGSRQRAHLYFPIRPTQLGRCVDEVLFQKPMEFPAVAGPFEAAGKKRISGRPPRILVVEDNAINRRLAKHLLTRFGYECEVAVDGVEGFELSAQEGFDVILLDCRMPRMDGYEFARRFRERETARGGKSRTPIVALTANALQGDRELCLAAGMDGYLTKPLKQAALASTLELALSGKVLGSEASLADESDCSVSVEGL